VRAAMLMNVLLVTSVATSMIALVIAYIYRAWYHEEIRRNAHLRAIKADEHVKRLLEAFPEAGVVFDRLTPKGTYFIVNPAYQEHK